MIQTSQALFCFSFTRRDTILLSELEILLLFVVESSNDVGSNLVVENTLDDLLGVGWRVSHDDDAVIIAMLHFCPGDGSRVEY